MGLETSAARARRRTTRDRMPFLAVRPRPALKMPPPVASRPVPAAESAAAPELKALLAALAEARAVDVTGLAGAARGWVAKELVGPGQARLLLAVAPDEDAADE